MLCQHCKKVEATTHITQIINGETAEMHLCQNCAQELGYNDMFTNFSFGLSELFGSYFADAPVSAISNRVIRCEKCGSTFNDIARSGKIGCQDCYTLFYDRLMPSIRRMHGKTHHEGKLPKGANEEVKRARRISDLKKRLNKAVDEQNFELAAQLRDEIRELEAGNDGR
ncbi:MAG: hypothetical protein GXY95_00560 [Clostridiales bacterium]|jgi:protein arginine kinase activator|nr:hypothetical protein [Clostridiales bacterium]HOA33430.1 UvrB/UvrC motif-containing protein [Clostridiales bacterium]HOL79677.1 UvrB/UvrC motif-containing protein [Clostridiales bacterium]HPP67729.1 UvrB/UvrC motif-containing protein [Clostridiales bacterium]HPU66873.1 UvrB/UvrC motif-containing protein [Clostridiales bacterium]